MRRRYQQLCVVGVRRFGEAGSKKQPERLNCIEQVASHCSGVANQTARDCHSAGERETPLRWRCLGNVDFLHGGAWGSEVGDASFYSATKVFFLEELVSRRRGYPHRGRAG